MKNWIFIILATCSLAHTQAKNDVYFLGGAGMGYYQGDLNPTSLPQSEILNFSFKLGAGINFHPRFGAQAHFSKSNINGSDFYANNQGRLERGLTFSSPYSELGLHFKVRNLNGKVTRVINYVFGGMNVGFINPVVTKANTENFTPESGFSKTVASVPFGFGIGYWLSPNVGLVWETAMRVTYSDYLDGVSEMASSEYNDGYIDSHILLLFKFGQQTAFNNGRGFEAPRVRRLGCRSFGH